MLTHSSAKSVTCSIVGDGMVGKSCICRTFAGDKSIGDYKSTVTDEYVVLTDIINDQYNIRIVDSSGQHEYKEIRTKTYKETDVFLVCYSVTDRDSFESVETFWIPEIRKICKKTPIILVGIGGNDRTDNDCVSKQEGVDIMDKCGASSHAECSSDNKDEVHDVFAEALLSVMKSRKRRRSSILRTLIDIAK